MSVCPAATGCAGAAATEDCAPMRWGGGESNESVFAMKLAPHIAISGEPAVKFKDIGLTYSSTKCNTNNLVQARARAFLLLMAFLQIADLGKDGSNPSVR
eukprot:1373205-Amphidinium_carterae.5